MIEMCMLFIYKYVEVLYFLGLSLVFCPLNKDFFAVF